MAEIVSLRENVSSQLDNAKVIELLEEVLAEAKKGEIGAVAICFVRPGNNVGNRSQASDDNAFQLLAAVNYLQYDMINVSRRCALDHQEDG